MRAIVVANQKGGCAKTTTIVNLAACLAELNHKVLVIDLDPQANATQWLDGNKGAGGGSFSLLSTKTSPENLVSDAAEVNVNIIAASQELATLEKVVAGELGVEFLLKRRLPRSFLTKWDYVLVDTPPTLGLLTINALTFADELLIPVTTHVMSLTGVTQLLQKVQEIKELLNPNLSILGYLPSRVDLRTRHAKEILQSLKSQFGNQVLKSIIRENIRLAEAPSFLESIVTYDEKSLAAKDYRDLAHEIIQLG